MITGLNHITIAVSDLDTSLAFYTELLGMKGQVKWDKGAYLSAGELWFCLSLNDVAPSEDYTHIAFTVAEANFEQIKTRLTQHQVPSWKENKSEGESLYILDPDGHKLELHLGSLASRLASLKTQPYQGLVWL